MNKLFLTTTFIICCICSMAQNTFEKSFGGNTDSAASVCQLSDGSFVISGTTNGAGAGNYDAFLMKTNASGSVVWSKTYGGNGPDSAHALLATSDGGFLITGSTTDSVGGNQDIFLVRTDSNGNLIWSGAFGGTGADAGKDAIETADGSFVLTGYSKYSGLRNVYLAKVSASGTGIFETILASEGEGNSVVEIPGAGFIIDATLYNNAGWDVLMMADETGNWLWSKVFVGDYAFKGKSIIKTSEGDLVIGGTAETTDGSMAYLLKTDANGNHLWTKYYSSGKGIAFKQTADSGFVFSSEEQDANGNNIYITKTNAAGTVEWTKQFGTGANLSPAALVQTNDLGFAILGNTSNGIELLKTNEMGNTACSGANVNVSEISAISTGYDVQFVSDLFSQGPEISLNTIASYDAGFSAATLCAVIQAEQTAAQLISEEDLIMGNDSVLNESFESKALVANSIPLEFNVFPNPGNGSDISISLKAEEGQKVLVVLVDALGKEQYSKIIIGSEDAQDTFAIDPSGKLAPGIYTVIATSNKNVFSKRLIVR